MFSFALNIYIQCYVVKKFGLEGWFSRPPKIPEETIIPLTHRYLNFLEVGSTFIHQKCSVDHLNLVPFESKFIIFSVYFNTSLLVGKKWKIIAIYIIFKLWDFQLLCDTQFIWIIFFLLSFLKYFKDRSWVCIRGFNIFNM